MRRFIGLFVASASGAALIAVLASSLALAANPTATTAGTDCRANVPVANQAVVGQAQANMQIEQLQAQISVLQSAVNDLYKKVFGHAFNPAGPNSPSGSTNGVSASDDWETPVH